MTEPRRPRRVTTGTWQGLTPGARADLYASDFLRSGSLDEPSGIEGIEQFFDVKFSPELYAALRAICVKMYLAGTEREQALSTALEVSHTIRLRLELILRENGFDVPTDPLPSEPPEK